MCNSNHFSRVDHHVISLVALLAQMIVVPMVSFALILPIGSVLAGSGPYSENIHHPYARFGMPPISIVGGFLLGRLVYRCLPWFARMGRWSWMLAAATFGVVFFSDLRGGSAVTVISMFDVEGRDDLAVWLFSLPTLFSVGYSIASFSRMRPKNELT